MIMQGRMMARELMQVSEYFGGGTQCILVLQSYFWEFITYVSLLVGVTHSSFSAFGVGC
jgi:hypothetical protein